MTQTDSSPFRQFLASFSDLRRLPVAFWIVLGAFVIDSAAYFGVLTRAVPGTRPASGQTQ